MRPCSHTSRYNKRDCKTVPFHTTQVHILHEVVRYKHNNIRYISNQEQQPDHNKYHRQNLPYDTLDLRFSKSRNNKQQHTKWRCGKTDHHVQADYNAEMNKVNTHSLYQRKNHWYEYQLDSTYIKYTAKKQEYDVYDKQENVLVICDSHNQACNNSRNLLQRDDVREQHGSSAKESQCSCVGSGFLDDTPKLFPSQCFVNQC